MKRYNKTSKGKLERRRKEEEQVRRVREQREESRGGRVKG